MTAGKPLASRRIGIDIGRVLIGSDTDAPASESAPSMFGPDFLDAPAVPGGLAAVKELVREADEVHLVSKCGPKVQNRTERWLEAHGVYDLTELSPERVHFVRDRADKGPVASRLRLDTFVDDRFDVLAGMPPLLRTRILFGPQKSKLLPLWAIRAETWLAALRVIKAGLESAIP